MMNFNYLAIQIKGWNLSSCLISSNRRQEAVTHSRPEPSTEKVPCPNYSVLWADREWRRQWDIPSSTPTPTIVLGQVLLGRTSVIKASQTFFSTIDHQFLQNIFWINPTFAIPATITLASTITTFHVDHGGFPSGLLTSWSHFILYDSFFFFFALDH